LVVGAVALQGAFVLSHHPYYLAFYNPLAGGPRLAPSVLPLGWGEGMDLAAGYLNQLEDAPKLAVATAGIPGFAALFPGTVEPFTEAGLAVSDYSLAYVAQVQQQAPLLRSFAGLEPEHVVQIRGMDYVWIYRNEDHSEVAAYLRAHMGSGDALLLDAPSPLQHTFPDARVLFDPPNEALVREALEEIASDHERLWYLHYPAREPHGWLNDALSTRALLWSRTSVGAVSLSRYALPSASAFQRAEQDIALDIDFGGQLRLLGCQLSSDTVEYRQHGRVTLRWEALSQPRANYAVSLRLADAQGRDWARDDAWILSGYGAATAAWSAGERSVQRHLLAIPPGIPPGPYELRTLVYDTESQQALPVSDPVGAAPALEPTLATIQVAAATFPADPDELSIPHRLNQEFAGVLALLGYGLGADTAVPGDVLEVSTFWEALRPMQQDYALELALEDDSGQVWSQATFALPNDSHPTHLWEPAEVLHVRSDWPLAAALPSGTYRLSLRVLHQDGQPLVDTRLAVAPLQVHGRERQFTAPEPGYEMQAQLGDRIALVGHDLAETSVPAGGTLHLILHWQALSPIEQSYTVFAHLLDQENRIRGQWDSVPCSGECPTTGWLEGEFIADAHAIEVAADAPPGTYRLAVGLYDPVTMDRLTAMDGQGARWPDDRIELGTAIAVRPAE